MKNIFVIISDYHVSAQVLGEETKDGSILFHKEIPHEKEMAPGELVSRVFVLLDQMVRVLQAHGEIGSMSVLLSGPFVSEEVREIIFKSRVEFLVDQKLLSQMKRQDSRKILQEDPNAYVISVGISGIFVNGFLKQNPLGLQAKEIVIRRIITQASPEFMDSLHRKIHSLSKNIEYIGTAIALLPVLSRGGSTCCIVPHRHMTDVYTLDGDGKILLSSFQEGVFDIIKKLPKSLLDSNLAHSSKVYAQREVKKSHSSLYKKQLLGSMQKRWLSHIKEILRKQVVYKGAYGEVFVVAPPQISQELEALIESNIKNMQTDFMIHNRSISEVSTLTYAGVNKGGLHTLVSLLERRHNGID